MPLGVILYFCFPWTETPVSGGLGMKEQKP